MAVSRVLGTVMVAVGVVATIALVGVPGALAIPSGHSGAALAVASTETKSTTKSTTVAPFVVPQALAKPAGSSGEATIMGPLGVNGAANAADAILAYGTSTWPSVFGGVSLTNNGNSLVVHLVSTDPTVVRGIEAVTAPMGIVPTFVIVPATAAQLDSIMADITAAADSLKARGITMASWAVVGQTGLIEVDILNGTDAQGAAVVKEFGPLVKVVNVTELPMSAVSLVHR
jgi:hypothetical protein